MDKMLLVRSHAADAFLQHGSNHCQVESLSLHADNEEAGCSSERLQLAQKYCSNPQSVAVLQRQHLFTVYLHPLPDFGNFPEESIFHGREIQDRIQVGRHWLRHIVGKVYMGRLQPDDVTSGFQDAVPLRSCLR